MSPETLVRGLQEVDSRLIDLIMRQRGYEIIGGVPGLQGLSLTEQDRIRAVEEARYMDFYDVQTNRAKSMWTDFGFGQRIDIEPVNDDAKPVWEEFWTAPRNSPLLKQRRLHDLSDVVVRDGEEFFLLWFSTLDGEMTLRRLLTHEINEIVHAPDDEDIPLFYVRNVLGRNIGDNIKQIYYPDWQAFFSYPDRLDAIEIPSGVVRADDDEMREHTGVVALPAMLGKMNGRGWPQLKRALEWSRAYRDFLGDRAAVARAVAMYVDKIKATGGSRAVNEIIASQRSSLVSGTDYLDTNPPPAPGSVWVENQALERSRVPLTTGAGDARMDGMTLLGQFAAGSGAPLHWLGRPDAMQNRATAREALLPWIQQMERYQVFWTDVFSDMVEIVLRVKGQYGGEDFDGEYAANVTMEAPLDIDTDDFVRAIGAVVEAATNMAADASVAQRATEELITMMLSDFGVRDAQSVLYPEEEQEAKAAAASVVEFARANYRDGTVDADPVIEFLLGVLADG
jgi:hypothetical protein